MAILTRRFLINTTAAVTIALTQNGQTSTVNVASWGNATGQKSMTLSVSDSVTGTEGYNYAPHSVSVEANPSGFPANSNSYGSYDALVGEIMYFIDFGDPGGSFTVPQNMPTGFDDRNKGYAKKVTHVYRASGTYTITAWAYDYLGNWATASTQITVKADDFDATNTVVMSALNDFTGAPASNYHVTTWSSLKSTMQSLKATQPIIKVWLKYGETYSGTDGLYLDSYGHFILDAWGTPANGQPVVEFSTALLSGQFFYATQSADHKLLKVSNIKFTGPWDATIERRTDLGVVNGSPNFLFMYNGGGATALCDYTFDKVFLDGFAIGFYPHGSAVPGRVTISEVTHHNHQDYLWFNGTEGMEVSIVGTRIYQPANVLGGSYNRWYHGNNRNQHFGIRTSYSMDIMFQNNDWLSEIGWNLQNTIAHQGCRFNTGGGASTMRVFMTRNKLQCSVNVSTTSSTQNPTNIYFDFNYSLVNNPQGATGFYTDAVGPIIRRNIFVVASTSSANCYVGSQAKSVLTINTPLMTAEMKAANKIIVEGNTVVDLRTNAQFHPENVGMLTVANATGVTVEEANNVWHAPNRTPAETAQGPLSSTSAGFEGDYPGIRTGYDKGTDTITGGDIAPGATLFVPYTSILDDGGNAVTQSSYSDADGRAAIKINTSSLVDDMAYITEDLNADPPREWAGSFFEIAGDISVSYGATGITFTNNSTDTWPNNKNYVVHVPRGNNAMPVDTAYATPVGTAKLYAITPSSAGYQTAVGDVPPFDFFGNPRGNHPNSTEGTFSPGALVEVA